MAHSARVQRSRAEETAARPLTSAATRSHPGHPRSHHATLSPPFIPRPRSWMTPGDGPQRPRAAKPDWCVLSVELEKNVVCVECLIG
jgi:hypothetical protein